MAMDARAAMRSVAIPEELRARCQAAAKRAGVTLFAVWQGLVAVLLWRAMGGGECDDVLLVGPYGRREEAKYQRAVGYFLNVVVYRYRVRWMVEERGMG